MRIHTEVLSEVFSVLSQDFQKVLSHGIFDRALSNTRASAAHKTTWLERNLAQYFLKSTFSDGSWAAVQLETQIFGLMKIRANPESARFRDCAG
jgi:hypothetical protein